MAKMDKIDKQLTKSLKTRALKCIRKADRTKSPKVKLDKAEEAIKCLKQAIELAENPVLERYIERCEAFKLKVQIDALRDQADQYVTQAEEDKEHLEILVKKALSRLQAILDIEPGNDQIQAEINRIENRFQVKLLQRTERPLLNFKGDWSLRIKFKLKGFQELLENWDGYDRYNLKEDPLEPNLYTIDFKTQDFLIFREIYEELKTVTPLEVYIDGKLMGDEVFTAWTQCYVNYLRKRNPRYCYGATPFTYNFIGCHKAQMRDLESSWENCWFRYGEMDSSLGIFFVDKEQLFLRIQANLLTYAFCPALNLEKLKLGLQLLPNSINPQKDKNWDYVLSKGEKVGVIPKGKEIFITLNHPPSGTPQPMETGATSQFIRCLEVLDGKISLEDLQGNKSVRVSCCSYCGCPYGRGSTFCSECGESFWREILGTRHHRFRSFFRKFSRKKRAEISQNLRRSEKADPLELESGGLDLSTKLGTGSRFVEGTGPGSLTSQRTTRSPEPEMKRGVLQLEDAPETTLEEIPSTPEEMSDMGDVRDLDREAKVEDLSEENKAYSEGGETQEQLPEHEREPERADGEALYNPEIQEQADRELVRNGEAWEYEGSLSNATAPARSLEMSPLNPDEAARCKGEVPVEEEAPKIESEIAQVLTEEDLMQESHPEMELPEEPQEERASELSLHEEELDFSQIPLGPEDPSGPEGPIREREMGCCPQEAPESEQQVPDSEFTETQEVYLFGELFEAGGLDQNPELSIAQTDLEEETEPENQRDPLTVEELIPQILEEDLKEELVSPVLDLEPHGSKKEESLSVFARGDVIMRDPDVEKDRISPVGGESSFTDKMKGLFLKNYRERKKLEKAFKAAAPEMDLEPQGSDPSKDPAEGSFGYPPLEPLKKAGQENPERGVESNGHHPSRGPEEDLLTPSSLKPFRETGQKKVEAELIKKLKAIKPKSDLSRRGVVRIVYSAIIDRDTCPLCRFLHGMVFHPDQPEADIFKPPLHKGCKCMRTYILSSEKPKNWPEVNFEPPSDELLKHLDLAKLHRYISERSLVDG